MFPRIRQEVSIAPEPSALRCSPSTTCVEVRQHLNQVETKPFQFSIFPYELLMFYSLHSAAPSCETQSDNLIGMHAYTVASVPFRPYSFHLTSMPRATSFMLLRQCFYRFAAVPLPHKPKRKSSRDAPCFCLSVTRRQPYRKSSSSVIPYPIANFPLHIQQFLFTPMYIQVYLVILVVSINNH